MQIQFSEDDLRPLIGRIVDEVVSRRDSDEARLGDQLAYDAGHAAQLLGLNGSHNVDDLRRRGKLRGVMAGKKYLYPREELLRFLREQD